jgi:hypothetical protein
MVELVEVTDKEPILEP